MLIIQQSYVYKLLTTNAILIYIFQIMYKYKSYATIRLTFISLEKIKAHKKWLLTIQLTLSLENAMSCQGLKNINCPRT